MRVEPKPIERVAWYLRPFFWNQRRKYGETLQAALLWARAPRLFLGVALLYGMIDRKSSPLSPALRSLLTVRVSQINHCSFCVDINSATLMKRGVSSEKIDALPDWRDNPLFDELEKATLAYAEAVTLSDGEVDDEMMAALRRHFDEDGIVELTGLIAFQNLSSKFNSALAVPPQGFCRIPGQTAAPQGEQGVGSESGTQDASPAKATVGGD
ncbi:carboxymuconolactone decarboxylase family protein [Algihabitans sp.]|uniref:carboxymuconolactone decarboxylase family protein n=1 Tax=Algihabitans sp. TaxID=2821514 RepID=UPI003BA9155D